MTAIAQSVNVMERLLWVVPTTGNWLPHDCTELHKQAEKWQTVSSLQEQEMIFSKYGTCYSKFWHLEYWDPAHQIVIDCMHNALEGNVQDHFHQILALTKESAKSKPVPPPAFKYKFAKIDIKDSFFPDDMMEKEAKQVRQIHLLLTAPLAGVDDTGAIVDKALFDNSITKLKHHLNGKNTKVLKFVCDDLKLVLFKPQVQLMSPMSNPKNFKKDWIQCLVDWVCIRFQLFYTLLTDALPPAQTETVSLVGSIYTKTRHAQAYA